MPAVSGICWTCWASSGSLWSGIPLVVAWPCRRPGQAPSRWGYLGKAFILAAYRNQGIGTQLLSAVLSFADENQLVRVVLSPSSRAISLYERAGFRPADSLMLRTLPTSRVSTTP